MADCWSCGAERGASFSCPTCGRLQRPSRSVSYFDALGLPRAMRLEAQAIEKAFREVSRKVHPDKVSAANAEERRCAVELTSLVNEAHRTLRDPQKRAEYLMRLEGVDVAREDAKTKDSALLLEMLELQEKIEQEKTTAGLEAMRENALRRHADRIESLARHFDDHVGTKDEAIGALVELRYVRRLLERLDLKLEESV